MSKAVVKIFLGNNSEEKPPHRTVSLLEKSKNKTTGTKPNNMNWKGKAWLMNAALTKANVTT